MDYHLSHRPKKFKTLIGNKALAKQLLNALNEKNIGRFAHAIMLDGASGCGKTTIARIIAKKLGCGKGELIEVNAASTRGIDFIRTVINKAQYKPVTGKARVYIFDEAHQLSNDAQNGLLKLIEDYPKSSYFIFCSTNPEKILQTIKTRCAKYTVKTLEDDEIEELLKTVIKKEKLKVDKDVLKLVIEASDGIPRQALVYLGMVVGVKDYKKAKELIKSSIYDSKQAIDMCRALMQEANWSQLSKLIKDLEGQDYEKIRLAVLGYFTACIMSTSDKQINNIVKYNAIMEEFVTPLSYMNPKHDFIYRVSTTYLMLQGEG